MFNVQRLPAFFESMGNCVYILLSKWCALNGCDFNSLIICSLHVKIYFKQSEKEHDGAYAIGVGSVNQVFG